MTLVIFFWITPLIIYAQDDIAFASPSFTKTGYDTTGTQNYGDYYDEVPVTLNVPRIGSLEIQALIYGDHLYLPINELFDFLKIRNVVSPDFDLVEGFFIYPKDNYFIDKTNNRIVYQYNSYTLSPIDLIRTSSNLYLKSDYFGKVFGLECIFDFRTLSVTLNTKIELPAIREMQQELMRRNIGRLKGENKADTTIGRTFPLFHIGVADWSVISSQDSKAKSNTRANLGIGAIVAGGQLNLSLNYNSDEKINLKQQFYQWRLVNNDHSALRQVTAGKLFAQSTSSIYAPVIGFQFSNTPTTYRKSFGTYTLSNTTEPGWMVELYVNNVMVDYVKADASGFYTFEVPLVYGNSIVRLRFYGPWGEERTSEKYITIPFNFLPQNQLEYNVTAGIVDNDEKSKFARTVVNYGLAKTLTVGAGMEYLSTVATGKSMPFVNASFKLSQTILVSAEHTHGVRSKGIISYRNPSNLQVDVNYTRYVKNQKAIDFNFLDEKKLIFSMPFIAKKFTAFSRLTLNQFTLPYSKVLFLKGNSKFTSAEMLLSAVISGVSTNFTTFAILSNSGNPLVYSNLSFTFRLPGGIRFTPQAQYEYQKKNFSTLKSEIEKSLFRRGYVNFTYEKSLINERLSSMTLGLRYNFSVAQTFFSARSSRHSVTTTQSARGSLVYDAKTNYLGTNNQTSLGRGGIIISPFLDLNCNGKRESNEPKVAGLKLNLKGGGRIERNDRDTSLRITGLEAFTNYFIELDKNSFDNIAWQIKNPNLSVAVDPNLLKLVEVPVAVMGEVSGKVSLQQDNGSAGLGRIIVNIFNTQAILVSRLLSDSDGYFDFIGLPPGKYSASVDKDQLLKLKMNSTPSIQFDIAQNIDGDIINTLEFTLQADPEK